MAKHAKPAAEEEVPAYLRKSHRMRRILIIVVVVLLVLLAAGGFGVFQLLSIGETTSHQMSQKASEQLADKTDMADATDKATTFKTTTVPNLVSLLGKTQDEAIAELQHGAQVSSSEPVNEQGNPVKTNVRIMLTAEPADARTGTPTVYVGLNVDGVIVRAGYSASTSSLGFGSLSFADAVTNEHIIEQTLAEAGITIPDGTVKLPEDKMAYSTYGTDGTTLIKEFCSFSGAAGDNGASNAWSADLSYDYSTANATSNLADTIRTIYVYVNA